MRAHPACCALIGGLVGCAMLQLSAAEAQPQPSAADAQPQPSAADAQPQPSTADAQPQPSAADAHARTDMPRTLPDAAGAAAPEDEMPRTLPDDAPPPPTNYDDKPPLRFEANLVGVLGYPFAQDEGKIAFGFGVTYGVGWGDIPVLLGLDFMTTNNSDQTSTVMLELAGDGAREPRNKLARERTFYFDAWLRVQPPYWTIRPYVEGYFGTKLVQTRYALATSAADGGGSGDVLNDHAWASSLGWGAGVDFWGLWNAGGTISLTLGVRQLSGGDANFKRELLVDGQSATARFVIPTTITIFMAGIIGRFDLAAEPDPYTSGMP